MTDPKTPASRGTTEPPSGKSHPAILCKARIQTLCRSYLAKQAEIEDFERSILSLETGLFNIRTQIAELLGVLDSPLIVSLDDEHLILNVEQLSSDERTRITTITAADHLDRLPGEVII